MTLSDPQLDLVASYARARGWNLRRRTILVEGTTDEDLFALARRLEMQRSGVDLYANGLSVVASGIGDQGGAKAVVRELSALRCMAHASLTPDGRGKYRFVGLFDNDDAGRRAVAGAHSWDSSLIEYRDVFRLRPMMPRSGGLAPGALKRLFRVRNAGYEAMDWELEDLIDADFVAAFVSDFTGVLRDATTVGAKVHRRFTPDGKAKLHRYVREHAMWQDVELVVDVLWSMRYYLGLPVPRG